MVSDEASFHLSDKVNRYNVRIWGTKNPHAIVQHERDSAKVNVVCTMSQRKVYGPLIFNENTVPGTAYLDMLQNYLFLHLNEFERQDFIWQQDGVPPHFLHNVRDWLNDVVRQR